MVIFPYNFGCIRAIFARKLSEFLFKNSIYENLILLKIRKKEKKCSIFLQTFNLFRLPQNLFLAHWRKIMISSIFKNVPHLGLINVKFGRIRLLFVFFFWNRDIRSRPPCQPTPLHAPNLNKFSASKYMKNFASCGRPPLW